ncbi:Stp1/IreP family PP2C-type Ser/Thr phosphatase [Alteribacillus sp. HJP-4]|uniref:Stp1/IreP family PP2C-type Ser/Thr phosphatase n=1 Tax=Alteribacillus sp. HJP-4 TaxID=2775394 RepID=UPI0035CD0ECE
MKSVFKTDTGLVRQYNEDSGGVFENKSGDLLAVVADGMGGHQAGDVASQMAVNLFRQYWEPLHKSLTPQEAASWLSNSILRINRGIHEAAQKDAALHGMGTTIIAAICTSGFVAVSHAGDSRAYFVGEDTVQLKSEDHSLVNELKKSGQLTEDEAENHPRKNVLTRALGTENFIKTDEFVLDWSEGEGILLCSDGLSNKLSSEDIKAQLKNEISLEKCAQSLIHIANERGGEDNISVAIVLHTFSDKELSKWQT